MAKFQNGSLVRISEDSEFYHRGNSTNPKDTAGIVIKDDQKAGAYDDYKYKVSWTNNTSNSYRERDLKFLGE